MGEGAISRQGEKEMKAQHRKGENCARRLHGGLEGGQRAGTRPNGGGGGGGTSWA